jgi:hypothetical protein
MKNKCSIIILLLIIVISQRVIAQLNNAVLGKKVVLPATTLRVDSLLQVLARQTGTRFSFNPGKVTPSLKIYFKSRQQTIGQVLTQVQQTIGVKYKLLGNHIILLDEPKDPVPKKPVAVTAVTKNKLLPGKPTVKNKQQGITMSKTNSDIGEKHVSIFSADTNDKKDDVTTSKSVQPDTLQNSLSMVRDTVSIKLTGDTNLTKDSMVTIPVAQKKPVAKTERSLNGFAIEGGLQGLGINYVLNIGQRSELEFSAGLGGGYFITGQQFYYAFNFLKPSLYAKTQLKVYLKDKAQKEGSYFGLNLKYATAHLWSGHPYDSSAKWLRFKGYTLPAMLLDAHLGIQKQLGPRWRMDGHLGIGYSFNFSHRWELNHWYPAAGLKVSYRLKK